VSANLGSLNNRLRLQCHYCGWPLPDDMTMEGAQLHFQVDHDTDEVKLDLVPACRCSEAMTHTESHTAGKQITDFFRCGVCSSTGYTTRKAEADTT
jgi:hypothetical protein